MNFFKDLEKYSNNVALITEKSNQVSYKDLLETADILGGKIKKRCLVFVVCKNSVDSVAGYVGFLRAHAVMILVNNTIDHIIFENLLETYKPEYIYLPNEKSELKIETTHIFSQGLYSLLKTKYVIDYTLHDDLALLLTTSGSTGDPKMVRQSYKNIKSNVESMAQYLKITSEDRPITTMPMSYTYGLSIINSHLFKGASIIVTEATLMNKSFWTNIKVNQATTFGGVPYIYEMLKKLRFERMDLPNLKYVTQAGGKLNSDLFTEFTKICAHKGIKFYVMYGQTEATARMSYLPWKYAHTKIGSIGIAIPGGQFWLEDENGHIIKESELQGELVYQGDNVTMGYAQSCFDLSKEDENKGILYTGDLAKRDVDGFYHIVGRKKRFLKMFGNRINLDDVEKLLREDGYDCACVGTDDDLKIYVTKYNEKSQIQNYVAKRIGINRTGFSFVAIDHIPRSDSGKILYSELI